MVFADYEIKRALDTLRRQIAGRWSRDSHRGLGVISATATPIGQVQLALEFHLRAD